VSGFPFGREWLLSAHWIDALVAFRPLQLLTCTGGFAARAHGFGADQQRDVQFAVRHGCGDLV
jgi:hypothetical protein